MQTVSASVHPSWGWVAMRQSLGRVLYSLRCGRGDAKKAGQRCQKPAAKYEVLTSWAEHKQPLRLVLRLLTCSGLGRLSSLSPLAIGNVAIGNAASSIWFSLISKCSCMLPVMAS